MLAYTGLPGSGKSYGVVENVIIPALKEGRRVWTNIPMYGEKLLETFGSTVTQFDIVDIQDNPYWFQSVLPKGAVCVIDECQMIWPNGMKVNSAPVQHREFFTQYRHDVGEDGFSTTPILVTQDLANVANFVRSMVSFTYRATRLDAVGQSKRYRIDVFQGPATGPNPPASKRLRELYGSFKKDVYDFYKSHTKSDVGAGKESTVDKRFNVLAGVKLKSVGLTMILGAVFAVWGLKSVYGYYANGGKKEPSEYSQQVQIEKPGVSRARYSAQAEQQTDYLKGKDISIVFNMGKGSSIKYIFEISGGNDWYQLDVFQLKKLGYLVTMVNECLVIITSKSTGLARPVSCRKSDGNKGLFDWNIKSDSA